MSLQKSGLEGTYRWIPVSQELPDDSETVLICNLEDWDDPVTTGAIVDGKWEKESCPGCPYDGKGYTEDGDAYPDPFWNPPTHWMRLPEPPGLAILSESQQANPFKAQHGIVCGVEDRCKMVQCFTAMQCLDALCLPNLEKTVRTAIERRLRKLERSAK